MERKLASIYYSPRGYWKGLAAIKNLSATAKVTEQQAKASSRSRPSGKSICLLHGTFHEHIFDIASPNEVNQADPLFLPHSRVGWKTSRYALTVVDVASSYKEAEPLTSKTAAEAADFLSRIYRRGPLKWPKLLQVDPGREFMGAVSQLLAKHGVSVRRGRVDSHRDQGIVERFNRTLAERLFGQQYAQEMPFPECARSTEWVKRLPAVVAALNGEDTWLTGKKSQDAIRTANLWSTTWKMVLSGASCVRSNSLLASVAQLDAPSDWRPGGRGFNPRRGRQHSFVEIDHEIFSTVILSLPLIQEGQLSVSGERMCTILVNRFED